MENAGLQMIRYFSLQQQMFIYFFGWFGFARQSVLVFLLLAVVLGHKAVKAQDQNNESDDPVAIFNQGQDAHEKGDLTTAIGLYKKALKISPEFPEAELQLGNAFQALGQIDDAEAAFRRAVELRPDWPLAITNLGSLLVSKAGFAEAEPLLAKAISLDAQNFDALSAMTEVLVRTNAKPEKMQSLLEKIKVQTGKAKPTASLWTARGSLESAMGDSVAAGKSFVEALTIDPRNRPALFAKAEVALKENDLAGAEETAKTLEKLTGNSEASVILHARALIKAGRIEEATKLLDSIPNPTKETVELRTAITASTSENVADLENKLLGDPKNAVVLSRLCSLYRVSDPNKALEYCKRAANASPKDIGPAIGYGAALVQAKRNDEAIALFRKILEVAPDNATVHSNLATALFESKRYADAKAEYRWLTEKQPNLAVAYFFLAICHDQLREYPDAMANYQQFLKLADPAKQHLEIDKVNLRIPTLDKQLKKGSK